MILKSEQDDHQAMQCSDSYSTVWASQERAYSHRIDLSMERQQVPSWTQLHSPVEVSCSQQRLKQSRGSVSDSVPALALPALLQ
jgi:hypothetical protein